MKVLMLGWEFPPLFRGCLGIAAHGRPSALSPKVNLKHIISNAKGQVLPNPLKGDFRDTDKYANYLHALLIYQALHQQFSKAAHDDFTVQHGSMQLKKS